jgi:hypothetical protein
MLIHLLETIQFFSEKYINLMGNGPDMDQIIPNQ